MWLPKFIKDIKLGDDIILIDDNVDDQGKLFITRNPLESWLVMNNFEVISYHTLDKRIKIKVPKIFVLDKEEKHMWLSDLLYPHREAIKEGKCIYIDDLVKMHIENYLEFEIYNYGVYY